MSETLIGVIIGGVLGILSSLIALIVDLYKWRKERRLNYLNNKRQQMSTLFLEVYDKMKSSVVTDAFDIELLSSVEYLCPPAVLDTLTSWIEKKDRSPESKRQLLLDIANAMKAELRKIDNEIEKIIE